MSIFKNACIGIFSIILLSATLGCTKPGSKEFSDGVMKAIEENPEKVLEIITQHAQKAEVERREQAAKGQQQELEEQFTNPLKPSIDNRPMKGVKNAAVTIVEYSDFQCPYCSRAVPTLDRVMKEYTGKVNLVFKHLPLNFHPHAMPAAKAAVAAANQGKFFEFHDELFNQQRALGPELYTKIAQKLNLNLKKFNEDMASAKTQKLIEEDMAEAQKMGIQGTPGFIINGVALKGAYPFEQFKQVIDRHLSKN